MRVLLVKGRSIACKGMKAILENNNIDCCEADDEGEVMAFLGQEEDAHGAVIILDCKSLPQDDMVSLIRRIHEQFPSVRTLAYAPREHLVNYLIHQGAWGCITKRCSPDAFLKIVQQTAKARLPLQQGRKEIAVKKLSPREMEVFRLIGNGHSTGEIAAKLKIGRKTVEEYKAGIKRKLGAGSEGGLAFLAVRHCLEDPAGS